MENNYNAPQQSENPGAAATFTEYMHKYLGSTLFLAGTILFTAGSVFWLIFSMYSIGTSSFGIGALFTGLPAVALWLMYFSSKSPDNPQKTLTALLLIKIHTIISIVVVIAVTITVLIGIILLMVFATDVVRFFMDDTETFVAAAIIVVSVIVLVTLAFLILIGILYYGSLLKILKNLKQNIIDNTFNKIGGVLPFTIIGFFGLAFTTFAASAGLLLYGAMPNLSYELVNDLISAFTDSDIINYYIYELELDNLLNGSLHVRYSPPFEQISNLMIFAGFIICIIVLNQINKGLIANTKRY